MSGASRPLYGSVEFLRGLAAVLILLVHVADSERLFASGVSVADLGIAGIEALDLSTLIPPAILFGAYAVDMFFVLSGFVMIVVITRRDGSSQAPVRFLLDRITRLYPMYWIATGLTLLGLGLGFGFVWSPPSMGDVVKSLVLVPIGEFPVLAVGWTLAFEMYFYSVVALGLILGAKALPFWLAGWGVALLLGNLAGWSGQSGVHRTLFSPLGLEFLAGCALGYARHLVDRISAAQWALLAAIGLVATTLPFAQSGDLFSPNALTRPLAVLPLCIGLLGLLLSLEQSGKFRVSPFWLQTGALSYVLYLFHVPVLQAFGTVFHLGATVLLPHVDLTGSLWDNLAYVSLSLVVCWAVALALRFWVELPLLRLSRDWVRLGLQWITRLLSRLSDRPT